MKIDGYWNLAFFTVFLLFALGIAGLGARKSPIILGYTPPTRPTIPISVPTIPPIVVPTSTPPPTAPTPIPTLPPNVPTPIPTNTPIPTAVPTIPTVPTNTPVPPPCPAQTAINYGTTGGLGLSVDFGKPEGSRVDLNLGLRSLTTVNQPKTLVNYTPDSVGVDANAPQFDSILSRGPNISQVYWAQGELDTRWPVNVLSLPTTPGEVIRVPQSGHFPAGNPNGQAVVIYARDPSVTFKYTANEGVVLPNGQNGGYTVYILGVCVNPGLANLYNQYANIRTTLPIVALNQVVGVAQGYDIKVGVRDGTGSLMDPRSHFDWWHSY